MKKEKSVSGKGKGKVVSKSELREPKPFYLKVVWGIISAIILIFFTMLINTIYQPQIDNFVEKNIYHKKPDVPDVTVTLNEIFRLPNDEFINMSELPPGEYQYRYNDLMAITFTPDGLPAVELKLNGQEVPFAIGRPINYIDYNRTVIQKNCAFFMPTKMVKNQSTRILIP